MFKSLLVLAATLVFSAESYAACADTVSEAKQNGVYNHFMRVSGNQNWLTLRRVSDGKSFSGGIRGNYFKLMSFTVKVCKSGRNGISAEASYGGRLIKGYIVKSGNGYTVSGLGSRYNGRYEP